MSEYEIKVLEYLQQIVATCELIQGFTMLCIALVALYILYKIINMLF